MNTDNQILLFLVRSFRPEIRHFHADDGYAVYLGLKKTALSCGHRLSYRLCSCFPSDDIHSLAAPADLCMFYFLCSTQEIADFLTYNFRNTDRALFLLNSSRYPAARDLRRFQACYRLPDHSIFAISSNPAFQAAISAKQENHFFTFWRNHHLCSQNLIFFEQLRRIHLLAADIIGGNETWMNKTFFCRR